MQRLTSSLAKPTPDHLQVVGPRFFGKTILMHSLAEKIRSGDARFKNVVLWDLAHNTPATDEDFIRSLVQQIANQIAPAHKDYADHLRGAGGNCYSELREVIDILDDEKVKVLLPWDGFDKAFGSSRLTRNLWDQMRDLASRPGLRIVTSNRKPLHELPRDSESKTSEILLWRTSDEPMSRPGLRCVTELFDPRSDNATFSLQLLNRRIEKCHGSAL